MGAVLLTASGRGTGEKTREDALGVTVLVQARADSDLDQASRRGER